MIVRPQEFPAPIPFSDEDTHGQTRSDAASPHESRVASEQSLIGLVVEPCALCRRNLTTDLLWPVIDTGLTCNGCIELLRSQEQDA